MTAGLPGYKTTVYALARDRRTPHVRSPHDWLSVAEKEYGYSYLGWLPRKAGDCWCVDDARTASWATGRAGVVANRLERQS